MKQDEKALLTKKAMAEALKRQMQKKPLSKITVSEIIADCNVNRKTFYYHFQDLYDLLKWILEEEAIEVVKKYDFLVDHEDAIAFVMEYVEKNKHIINCAYDSLGRDGMKRFLNADFIGIVSMLIESVEQQMNVTVDSDFKQFLCEFYTEALSGILINWFRSKTNANREETIQNMMLILRASLPSILAQYTSTHNPQQSAAVWKSAFHLFYDEKEEGEK